MLRSKIHRATVTGAHGEEEIKRHAPRIVRVNDKNRIIESK
jgi:aspartate 1-decarboxylase